MYACVCVRAHILFVMLKCLNQFKMLLNLIYSISIASLLFDITASIPVSYTHLDVYKRQLLCGCSSTCQYPHTVSQVLMYFIP